jgi:hypothetical protein
MALGGCKMAPQSSDGRPAFADLPRIPLVERRDQLTIWFAGGCQVFGYPVGPDLGFTEVALRLLGRAGWRGVAYRTGHVALTHPERLEAVHAEVAPDLLVLQLGSYETCLRVSVRVKRSVRTLAPVLLAGEPDANDWVPAPNRVVREDVNWRAHSLARGVGDWLTGHRLVDLPTQRRHLTTFLDRVGALPLPRVLVLSPLPCADPTILRYRRRFAPTFAAESAARGFGYLDAFECLSTRDSPRVGAALFADRIHLSALGHRLLGGLLATAIERTLLVPTGQPTP